MSKEYTIGMKDVERSGIPTTRITYRRKVRHFPLKESQKDECRKFIREHKSTDLGEILKDWKESIKPPKMKLLDKLTENNWKFREAVIKGQRDSAYFHAERFSKLIHEYYQRV